MPLCPRPEDLHKAYTNAINERLVAITAASKAIEGLLVKDTKDEAAFEDEFKALDKAVAAYNAFINKTIKPQFATWFDPIV